MSLVKPSNAPTKPHKSEIGECQHRGKVVLDYMHAVFPKWGYFVNIVCKGSVVLPTELDLRIRKFSDAETLASFFKHFQPKGNDLSVLSVRLAEPEEWTWVGLNLWCSKQFDVTHRALKTGRTQPSLFLPDLSHQIGQNPATHPMCRTPHTL